MTTPDAEPVTHPEPFVHYASEVAQRLHRELSEADVAHVRFLVQLAGRERFSPQLLRTRIHWFVTHNAGRALPTAAA